MAYVENRTSSRRSVVNADFEPRRRRVEVDTSPVTKKSRREVEPEVIERRRPGRPAKVEEPVVAKRGRPAKYVEPEPVKRGRPAKYVEPEPVRRGRKVEEVRQEEPADYTPREGSAAQIAIDLLSTKAARKNGIDFEEIMEALGYDPKYDNHRVSARVVLYKLKARGFDLENVGDYGRPAYRINN